MIDWQQFAIDNNLSIKEFKRELIFAVIAMAEQEAEENTLFSLPDLRNAVLKQDVKQVQTILESGQIKAKINMCRDET